MGRKISLRSRAVHLVSDLTTVLLNPISDKPSGHPPAVSHPPPVPAADEDVSESKRSQPESVTGEGSEGLVDGPDTSSFTAFLYSLLSSTEPGDDSNMEGQDDNQPEMVEPSPDVPMKGSGGKKSLFSRGRSSLGRVFAGGTRISANQNQEQNGGNDIIHADGNDAKFSGVEMGNTQNVKESVALVDLPDISEPSLLLSEKTRRALYASLPAVVQGRKWLMLYSTWRHGISLSTLYRRSMLWPGLSLLVVGDRKGAVFGGLVEAPLTPTNKRKYQGTNSTFVFSNAPGHPVVFRPTGANRYFTLCSNDFLAIGGGSHFALYLDADLLTGSSSVSETYGNPCLAFSEDFEVKEVELWGFVYASKFDEILASSTTEAPGISRW